MIFQTKRLIIRHFTQNDFEAYFDMVGNSDVMRYVKKTLNLDEAKQELTKFIEYYDNEKIFFNIWAVEEKGSQQVVGLCGVYQNEDNEIEIAYRLRASFWGNGFGSEIAKGLLEYCFKEFKVEKLVAYVVKENIGSVKILEKEMNFITEFYNKKNGFVEYKFQINNR